MADHTSIEWCDASWPVMTGCTHVSPGCDNCYAARLTGGRLKHRSEYAGLVLHGKFTGEAREHPARLNWPLKWRKPRKIFVADMGDLFHEKISVEFIARVFAVMSQTPRHTYQVLTKRHARMRSLLSSPDFIEVVQQEVDRLYDDPEDQYIPDDPWPLSNVWCGVSVEDQKWADIRVPALLRTPAAVRFLSAEPLLGPVRLAYDWLAPRVACAHSADGLDRESAAALADLARAVVRHHSRETGEQVPGFIDWVIVGGESGPGARRMDLDWAVSLRDQCQASGVPMFMKQLGSRLAKEHGCADGKGGDPSEWPVDFPREYPEVTP